MDQSVEERVRMREAELVSEFDEKERQLEKAKEELQARMTLADSKVSTMRQGSVLGDTVLLGISLLVLVFIH